VSEKDWYAGLAMQAFLAKHGAPLYSEKLASDCYELADAMMAERTKRERPEEESGPMEESER